jgi:hypothetical protein
MIFKNIYNEIFYENELTTLVVIGTGCRGTYKSNYLTIPTTTALIYAFMCSQGNTNFISMSYVVVFLYIISSVVLKKSLKIPNEKTPKP